jgi:hypothetical protein
MAQALFYDRNPDPTSMDPAIPVISPVIGVVIAAWPNGMIITSDSPTFGKDLAEISKVFGEPQIGEKGV